MRLRVADLFCGTGGFSHGFVQTGGFEVALGIDVKPASVETFAANHLNALALCQDIRKVRVRDVADRLGGARSIDVVVAGPPCQGFSSIRPFRSLAEDDPRNSLFEQVLVFVEFFKPRFVVIENVVGMMQHRAGSVLPAITQSLDALGYRADVRLLNAVHYGIPQKRERVIVLAERGNAAPRFPAPTHFHAGRSMARRDAPRVETRADLAPAVTVKDAIGDLPAVSAGEGAERYGRARPSEYARARRVGATTLSLHASTAHGPRMLEIIRQAGVNRWALPEGLTRSGFSSCYSRLRADEPSTTLTVNFVHPASNRCIHPTQDRALTPREGARIQSFDDAFVFRGSRTEIVKQIGEAVPPLLGRAIASSLLHS
jgi:DNA (cytosine-5)-methyltransferase 1